MQRSQRIGLVAVALVVAVVAFLVLRDSDDETTTTGGSTTTQTTQTTETTDAEPAETTEAEPTETEPESAVPTIRIKGGKAVGGVQDIEVRKGDRLRFEVRSDAAHEIHLHGYDIEKEVEDGAKVSFSLKASIEGIFEVEIEELGEQIAEVRVNP